MMFYYFWFCSGWADNLTVSELHTDAERQWQGHAFIVVLHNVALLRRSENYAWVVALF